MGFDGKGHDRALKGFVCVVRRDDREQMGRGGEKAKAQARGTVGKGGGAATRDPRVGGS